MAITCPASQSFASLSACAGLAHAFLLRQPDIDVSACDKDEAVRKLTPVYQAGVAALGFPWESLRTLEQVHGSEIVHIGSCDGGMVSTRQADGLMTGRPGVLLGILVADCCAIYVVDPVRHVIALLHSGKRGTSLGILSRAIAQMRRAFQCDPRDLLVQLSPCIRPPLYEVDFAAAIRRQAVESGVLPKNVFDTGECTACSPFRYYSYRAEKGRTGRMLALLGIRAES